MYKHLKLALIMLAIIINTILYTLCSSPQIYKIFITTLNKVIIGVTNPTIRVHGNTTNFSNNNLLIMSNHYHPLLDGHILHNLYHKNNSIETLHTIVKADMLTDPTAKSKILHLLSFLQDTWLSSWYFIPYKRGDKADGQKIRNTIVDTLNNGKNILVFPEGTSHKNGFPKEFKKGTFEVAVENKLRILPITIKYETDECYKQKNPEGLKNKVYTIITAPLLQTV